MWQYVFMTARFRSGDLVQKNFSFNNFRTSDLRFTSQPFGREPNACFERD